MKRMRWRYAMMVSGIICLGILSRKFTFVPLFAGDLLYAMMVFYMIRMVFVRISSKNIAGIALVVCFLIEISQLYQATWINDIRQTLPGRYILGQGFLWTDLLAYTIGIGLAFLLHRYRLQPDS